MPEPLGTLRPEEPSGISFEELREARRLLVDIVKRHRASVEYFKEKGPWFRLHDSDSVLKHVTGADDEVHHLSTTASCLESLLDVGPRQLTDDPQNARGIKKLVDDFA